MCGINGFNFTDRDLILKMNRATNHRGPDQTDFWLGENISLGHNRLAIIDLSERGRQPMWDAAKELVIVYNGEIYNYKELRCELERKYKFYSQSDTEVIVYAYREWGKEAINKFNGIFAFAIWDTRSKELFMARDRLGIKPLYYFCKDGYFIFSSEIKALLEHNIPKEVDGEAFNLYFQLLYIPAPHTMFKDIKKLPPASYLLLEKNGELRISNYWQINDSTDMDSYSEARALVRETFLDGVRRQLVSDRSVGVFLSGGIDSTAVLGAASQFQHGPIKTFSVGFKDSLNPEKFNADFFLAKKTATYYCTNHYELLIGPDDIKNNLDNIVWHLDEPNFNPTAGAAFLLSKMAKTEVAVVLGGDGGDELFGGYPRYYYSKLISIFQKLPCPIRDFLKIIIRNRTGVMQKFSLPANEKRIVAFLAQKQELLNRILSFSKYQSNTAEDIFFKKYFSEKKFSDDDFEKFFMNIDREGWLVDESLMRTDKMTMSFGLEERVPILDHRLVELSNKIPTKWKVNVWRQWPENFQGKMIWRDAIKDFLPEHIRNEKKRGWFTPMAKWLRGDLRDYVSDILSPSNLSVDYFNNKQVWLMWQDHLHGRQYNLNMIWSIVMWQLWYDQFIKHFKQ